MKYCPSCVSDLLWVDVPITLAQCPGGGDQWESDGAYALPQPPDASQCCDCGWTGIFGDLLDTGKPSG